MSGATIAPSHWPFYRLVCDLQVNLDDFEHFLQIFWNMRFCVKNSVFLRQKPVFLAFLTFFTCFLQKRWYHAGARARSSFPLFRCSLLGVC